jgi:hypothetical protein
MNRHNDLQAFMFEASIHTGVVIACFDAFCHTLTKKTVVVVDNASIHTSEEFEDRIPYWKKQGLVIKYLRPYSPDWTLAFLAVLHWLTQQAIQDRKIITQFGRFLAGRL